MISTPLHDVLNHVDNKDEKLSGRPIYSGGPVISAIDHTLLRLQKLFTYWGLLALTGLIIMSVAISLIAISAEHTSNFVQQQRRASIMQECNAQNRRHDNTINELNRIAAIYIKQHPSQAKAIKQSIGQNVLLINALQPKQDCAAVVKQEAGSQTIKSTRSTSTTRTTHTTHHNG